MVASVRVAGFRERSHGQDGHVLDRRDLLGALGHLGFEVGILVPEEIGDRLSLELRLDPRQDDGGRDRLRDVVRRPQLQAFGLVFRSTHGRVKDHGNIA
jgi:hypothetical protein